jgi:hypothetical protein
MRASLGVDACVGQAQAFDGLAADQMLLNDLRSVAGLHVSIPDGFRIDNNHRSMLALIKAKRFVDTHFGCETGGFRQLLQLGKQFALAVRSTGRARSVGGANVVTDEDMMFKSGQAMFLLRMAT